MKGVSRFQGFAQARDLLIGTQGNKPISDVGRRYKTKRLGLFELQQARKRSSGRSRKGRSQPNDVTVAVASDKGLRKPSAPNFGETLSKSSLRASAFTSRGRHSPHLSPGAPSSAWHDAGTQRTQPGVPKSVPPDEALAGPAASAGDRGPLFFSNPLTPSIPAPQPALLSPRPQAAPRLNSRVIITHCK